MEATRVAAESDLEAVSAVANEVSAVMADARGGALFLGREAGRTTVADRLRLALASNDAVAIAGTYDGVVFGYGIATVEELPNGDRLGVVTDLAVEASMRKVGIGEAIMNDLVDWLSNEGCIGVDAWALPGDRDTKNFFESFGLKARLLTVHKPL